MPLTIYVYVGMQVDVSTLLRGLLVLHSQTLSRCIIHTACTVLPTCVTRTLCLSVQVSLCCVCLCVCPLLSIVIYLLLLLGFTFVATYLAVVYQAGNYEKKLNFDAEQTIVEWLCIQDYTILAQCPGN